MKIIGITGSIASGKSTIAEMIADHYNLPLLSVDDFSKNWIKLYERGVKYLFKELEIPEELTVQETLRKNIFKHEELKAILENIISEDFWRYVRTFKDQTKAIVIEHPILFEMSQAIHFDFIIGVDADLELRKSRMRCRGYTPEVIQERLDAQLNFNAYSDKVDLILDNNGPLTFKEIYSELSKSSKFKSLVS